MPDNAANQEHPSAPEKQRPSTERAEYGSLLDGIRLIIAQGPDGDRLSRLVPNERSITFDIRNKYAEVWEAFERAESKFTEWAVQDRVEGEGFHKDTRTRAAITQREWQSRFIDIWNNRLINPLKGTSETYPWITDIEINLEKVRASANSQQQVANDGGAGSVATPSAPILNVTEPAEMVLAADHANDKKKKRVPKRRGRGEKYNWEIYRALLKQECVKRGMPSGNNPDFDWRLQAAAEHFVWEKMNEKPGEETVRRHVRKWLTEIAEELNVEW